MLIIDYSRDFNLVSLWIHQPAPEPCYQCRWQWRNSSPPETCLESQNRALTALEFRQNNRTIVGSFDWKSSFVNSGWTDCRDLSEHGRDGSNPPRAWTWGLSQGELLCSCKVGPHFQCSPLFSTSLPSLIYVSSMHFMNWPNWPVSAVSVSVVPAAVPVVLTAPLTFSKPNSLDIQETAHAS